MPEHKIFPHGAPREIVPGLWQVRGSLPFPLPRNMTVYRLPDGGLLLHSVVAMSDEGLAALERLGKPVAMLVPHTMHVMDAPFYKARYPELRVIAPADAAARIPGVAVEGSPDEILPKLGLRHRTAPGMKVSEIVLDLPIEGGRALVFTDLVGGGVKPKGLADRIVMGLLGPPGGSGVARVVKLRQIADKEAVRRFLRELATPDVRLVAAAHSPPIRERCAEMLEDAAARL